MKTLILVLAVVPDFPSELVQIQTVSDQIKWWLAGVLFGAFWCSVAFMIRVFRAAGSSGHGDL